MALETGSWIEMHFEDLEHFNSSTIASVIQFINAAHSRHVERGDALRPGAEVAGSCPSTQLRRALRPFESVSGSSIRFVPVPPRVR